MFQMYYADRGEVEVVVKKLRPSDLDAEFLEYHGMSEKSGGEARALLQQCAGSITVAVKGALETN